MGRKAHKALCSACCVTSGSCPTPPELPDTGSWDDTPSPLAGCRRRSCFYSDTIWHPVVLPCSGHKKPTVPDSTAHLGHSGCQYIQQNTGISHPPVGHRCTSHVHSCKLRETQEQVEPQPHQGTYGDIASCPIVYLECRNNLGNPEPWYRITEKGGSPERAR